MKKVSFNRLLPAFAAMAPALMHAQQRPNIMVILVDDMGYSDLQCFGGEVQSPSLNALAQDGSRFTQFYNNGRSCPSRAALMTGCYPHEVGITGMGLSMTRNCVTIPEVLRTAGYHTGMTGKWHLSLTRGVGGDPEQMKWLSHQDTFEGRPFSDKSTYPCNRGFDEHWGTIWGVTDHFDPFSLVHNEEPIFTDSIPEDFYYADFVADKTIDLLGQMSGDGKPFFMYVAFQEPHWPVQAKPQDLAKYKGVYDEGWDALRTRRYKKMVEMGIIDPSVYPDAPNEAHRPWADEKNQQWEAANMAAHAAMVDCVDKNIGRIIDELKRRGLYDNTLILFTSDNGASSENYTIGSFDRHDRTRNGQMVIHNDPNPGSQLTYNYLGTGWAGAINAPFRYWKRQSFHGGTAAPTIVKWPAAMKADKGNVVAQPCTFMDVMPTCIELAGATYPTSYNGNEVQPIADEAQSITPLARKGAKWDKERILYFEHEGGKAVRTGDWRLTKHTDGDWQLFDMKHDVTETRDVAAEHPEVVMELRRKWNEWAVSVGLRPEEIVEPTEKSLLFHCPFDGNLRTTGSQSITMNQHGGCFVKSNHKKALHMNGHGEYVDIETTGLLNPGKTQYTICAWVLDESTPNENNAESVLLTQLDNDGPGRIQLMRTRTEKGDVLNCFLSGHGNESRPGCFKRGEWQHVAVTYDAVAKEVTYYVNGQKVSSSHSGAFESCIGGFRIGGHKQDRSYWKGQIDELYVYNGILSETEIVDLMNKK